MARKLPEALKAHQFKKGRKKAPAKSKPKHGKKAIAGGVRGSMPELMNPQGQRVIRA